MAQSAATGVGLGQASMAFFRDARRERMKASPTEEPAVGRVRCPTSFGGRTARDGASSAERKRRRTKEGQKYQVPKSSAF